MTLAKRIPYRNQKIRDAAKGEECTMNTPVCNYDPATVVFCHLNESYAGKGGSQKADDIAGFFACSACHEAYDRNQLETPEWYVLRAYYRTMRALLDMEVLRG